MNLFLSNSYSTRNICNTLMCISLFILGSCAQQDSLVPAVPEVAETAESKAFYQTLETPPAPVLEPTAAAETFVIAPGFQIDLVASEPLVEDPVAADWDEDGHLYVVEMRAYMPDVTGEGEEQPIGAVVRLKDTDGDGVFDVRQVLIDDLVLPRTLRVVNDGLLIGEMGKLWLCPSPSGWSRDIDFENKRFLGPYGEHQGSVEHAENGLMVGLDNWLYNAKSARRLKLIDGDLIEERTLFRGQWGITQDDAGRLYYNTNSNLLLGDLYDALAVIEAGNRKGAGLNTRISPNDEVFSIRVNPGVNRAYVPGVLREDGRLRTATSASGMVVYRGGMFVEGDPDAFVTEPAANLITAFKLSTEPEGRHAEHRLYANERWGQRDFLASTDERFRPVDVLNGPDGGLYVIDFYRGVIQDHVYLSDELKAQALQPGLNRPLGMGRIWRVAKTEAPKPQALPDWRQLDTQGLVELLAAPDIWRRSTAQRLLLRSENIDVGAPLTQLIEAGSDQATVHALWILEGRGELEASAVRLALSRGDRVAEAALLAGGELLEVGDLVAVMEKSPATTRLYLYALGALRNHISDPQTISVVQNAILDNSDNAAVGTFAEASVRSRELDLITRLVQQGHWSAALEKQTGTLGRLALQLFRAEGAGVVGLLDYVEKLKTEQFWAQRAVIDGLFERTREPGFERVVLSAPHKLFATKDTKLWPVVAKARRGFTWEGDTLAADAKPLTPAQTVNFEKGKQFFTQSCANCHGTDGGGVGALGPPLADSSWVTDAPERLARIVLQGLQGPIEVAGKTWDSAMPGHENYAGFDNNVASGLLTFLRRAWGHSGRAIDPNFVAGVRQETSARADMWTVAELSAIAINTHYEKYTGQFGRPSSPIVFGYDGKDLTIASGIFNGLVVEQKEDHFLFEPRNLHFEFVIADDGSVPAVMMHTAEGSIPLPRVPQ